MVTTRFCLLLGAVVVLTAAGCENLQLDLTLHSTPPSQHRSSVQWPVGYGHIITGSEDQILIMGGYTNYPSSSGYLPSDIVWGYTPSTSSWTRTITTGDSPPEMYRACAVELDGKIFLHGGRGRGGYNNDLFTYEINENKWRKEGGGGKGRQLAVCFVNKATKKIHIFGGRNGDGVSNELRTYHDGTWRSATDGSGPSARRGMAAATVGEAVFLHGGYDGSRLNDLWRLNLISLKWDEIHAKGGAAKPQPRQHHSLTALSDDVLLLIGGYNSRYLSDVWTYTISTNDWKQQSDLPAESLGGEGRGLHLHKAISITKKDGTQSVYVTGGYTGASPWQPKDILEYQLTC